MIRQLPCGNWRQFAGGEQQLDCSLPECRQMQLQVSGRYLAVGHFRREGGEVPRLHLIPPELDALDVLDLGELLMLPDLRHVKVAML